MAVDGTTVAVRFALYLDLMLLFGLPLFALFALRRDARNAGLAASLGGIIAAAAIAGLVLSLLALALMAKSLSGAAAFSELDRHVLGMILAGTDAGGAWLLRMAALCVCLAACTRRCGSNAHLAVSAAAAAVALATLAWTGHGAMNAGGMRYLHLGGDIAHLLAAGAWVGALAAFVLMSSPRRTGTADEVALLGRVASGFAWTGTAIVTVLAATGLLNYLAIVGATLDGLGSTAYGRLLSVKLLVFAAMLVLAAANRYRLCPRLERAMSGADRQGAVRALRRSLRLEATAATAVLALVALLGVLSPAAS